MVLIERGMDHQTLYQHNNDFGRFWTKEVPVMYRTFCLEVLFSQLYDRI